MTPQDQTGDAGFGRRRRPYAQPTIRLRGLRKQFGKRVALAGIDLDLTGPQLVGLAGPDGAGKTTLLRALAGLLEVAAGEGEVLGYDLAGDVLALKSEVGYVPQAFSLPRELWVMENLRFTARLHPLAADEFERRAAALLERTGLAPFTDRPAGALSGGMKQKLAVSCALLPHPVLASPRRADRRRRRRGARRHLGDPARAPQRGPHPHQQQLSGRGRRL